MTVKLYWNDAYLKEFDSVVEKVEGNRVVLRETVFYPTGGGVMNDTGMLTVNGVGCRVADVSREGDVIFHHLEGIPQMKAGDSAHGTIDWDRRYSLMRYHTAVHLMDGVVERKYQAGGITGGQIFPDRARIDFAMTGLNREMVQKIIDEANAAGREGHNVLAKNLTKEEALARPNLARTEPGREMMKGMDSVRVVEIEGIDMQMDGGLHVANTKEIGKITLNGFENKGKNSKRIEIKLE
ncbi:MAG: alanyl-tRNA editing protein [Candidatus Micrarchaeota archaeon]|nr:alanyl-tRNA editing protein [Candidatus Micrarchaeota archaeon]